MAKTALVELNDRFMLNFYKTAFENDKNLNLTLVDVICLEIIKILDKPTISELTEFMGISQPNMTYRLAGVIDKGYLKKTQSSLDRREYYLELTEKYWEYNKENNKIYDEVINRIKEKFPKDKITGYEEMLGATLEEFSYQLDKE